MGRVAPLKSASLAIRWIEERAGKTFHDAPGVRLPVVENRATGLLVNRRHGYSYGVYGRLASTMIGPANAPTSTTTYTYNQLGQLEKVTVTEQNGVNLSTPEVTRYEYDLGGKLVQQTDPNGVVDQYTYNNVNELTEETETGPGNAPIAEYQYSYRPDGAVVMHRAGNCPGGALTESHPVANRRHRLCTNGVVRSRVRTHRCEFEGDMQHLHPARPLRGPLQA